MRISLRKQRRSFKRIVKAPRREEFVEQSRFVRIIARVVTKVVAKVSLFVAVHRSLSSSSFRSLESSSSILLSIGVSFVPSLAHLLARSLARHEGRWVGGKSSSLYLSPWSSLLSIVREQQPLNSAPCQI